MLRSTILTFGFAVSASAFGSTSHYRFDTDDYRVNAASCLEDLRPHGAGSEWACVDGVLQALSPTAGLKRTKAVRDLAVTFSIFRLLPAGDGGRGESVIWLRNGAVSGSMRRVRIVIEESAAGGAVIRLEQSAGGGYVRLAVAHVASYVGVYDVEILGSYVSVATQGIYVSAETDVAGAGGFYLFSSGGEGGYSAYDDLMLSEID